MLKKSHGPVRGLHGLEYSMEETWQTPSFSLGGFLNITIRVPNSRGQMPGALGQLGNCHRLVTRERIFALVKMEVLPIHNSLAQIRSAPPPPNTYHKAINNLLN